MTSTAITRPPPARARRRDRRGRERAAGGSRATRGSSPTARPARRPTRPGRSGSTSSTVGVGRDRARRRRASVVAADARGGHAEREVAAALRELLEREALAVGELRPDGLDEELVRRERRRVRAEEELVRGDLAAATHRDARPPSRRQATSASGSSAAASACATEPHDGAAVPRHRVPDVGEARPRAAGWCVQPRVGLADGRADAERAVLARDAVEPGDAVDVDEQRRAQQPHVERGHEALAAGEHLRLVAVLGERRERLVERLRPHVRRSGAGFTAGSSSQTRPGVNGSSTSSRPSASATAFAIAAGTLIVVPSPSPFAPSGRNGDGDSRWPIRGVGRSGAVGHEVVHERAGEEVPVLVVDDGARRAPRRAVGEPTSHLALGEQRVQQAPRVVHRDVVEDRDLARLADRPRRRRRRRRSRGTRTTRPGRRRPAGGGSARRSTP